MGAGRGLTLRLPASSEACRFLSTDDIVSFSLVARLCVAGERAPSPRATGLIIPRPERNGEMRVRNALVNGQRARRGFEKGREAKF